LRVIGVKKYSRLSLSGSLHHSRDPLFIMAYLIVDSQAY